MWHAGGVAKKELGHQDCDPLWGYQSPGETRWPACGAIVVALLLQWRLPEKLSIGPGWLLPILEGLMLLILMIGNPSHFHEITRNMRPLALAMVALMSGTNAVSLFLLIHNLLKGADATKNGRSLVYSAVAIWCTAVIAFALWFWEIDRGGPIKRCQPDRSEPDFLFTQMSSPAVTKKQWYPTFIDYLYLSLTNSTAFSPTDVLPLTSRAKILMGMQSVASLATIAVVGARAVNILG
jgi:uncharacterized membrane protein